MKRGPDHATFTKFFEGSVNCHEKCKYRAEQTPTDALINHMAFLGENTQILRSPFTLAINVRALVKPRVTR